MLEVDNYRSFNPSGYGHTSPPTSIPDAHTGQTLPTYASISTMLGQERQNQVVHWQQGGSPLPGSGAGSTGSSGDRSDEDDDEDYRPFTPPPPRERLSYTRYQLELLNGIYKQVRYPNSSQKQLIAKRVGITREQVKIWFQNRRRKDVVGSKKKPESDTSDKSLDSDSSLSDDSSDKIMVPPVVMKSIVSEIQKFEKDHLRPKKGKKKTKAKVVKQKIEKANIPKGLMYSGYDMISPPNQITPSAFLNRNGSKFHHSKSSSAFDTPKESPKYPNILTNFLETCGQSYSANLMQSPSRPLLCVGMSNSLPYPSGSLSYDLPVLSDLLSSKTGMDPKQREPLVQTPQHTFSGSKRDSTDSVDSLYQHPGFNSPFGINRVYPFPFIADPPVMLSTLRHMEPYRPQPHYPSGSNTDDINRYQPLTISSINNPYYSPTSAASWTNQNPASSHPPNSARFAQL